MNQNIITYLNEDKEEYPKDVLIAELRISVIFFEILWFLIVVQLFKHRRFMFYGVAATILVALLSSF